MHDNRLRTKLEQGSHPVALQLNTPDSLTAETISNLGFDAVMIDMQHSVVDFKGLHDMIVALAASNTPSYVRVSWNDPAAIMKVFDTGAFGVIVPMISTRADVESFVGACRYPPDGYRSMGPFRVGLDADYLPTANKSILAIALIETAEAFENVEDIASVPGLDALYPGPVDLTMALDGTLAPMEGKWGGSKGNWGIDYSDPKTAKRLRRVIDAAHKHGKWATLPELSQGKLAWELGADWITVDDMSLHMAALRADLAKARKVIDDYEKSRA
jgi:4-hydroxy-2-oxoheptanedioate aldolase